MKLNAFTEDIRYKLTDMEQAFTSNFALCSCSYRQNPQCSRKGDLTMLYVDQDNTSNTVLGLLSVRFLKPSDARFCPRT